MTNFKRGDVVLVLFPNSDLKSAKRRPVLIIQKDHLNSGLPQHIVAMITSNLARADHPSRVFINIHDRIDQSSGLLMDSVIMTDNLATILDYEFDRIIGHISDMMSVDKTLLYTLGMPPTF